MGNQGRVGDSTDLLKNDTASPNRGSSASPVAVTLVAPCVGREKAMKGIKQPEQKRDTSLASFSSWLCSRGGRGGHLQRPAHIPPA